MKKLERLKHFALLSTSIGIYFLIVQANIFDREITIADEFLTTAMLCLFGYSILSFYQTFKK
mgnify:CR=1 FL=1|tara:strand:+ start:148 stop:333 length:186 start_codon:yes stop_codon:yes gene_type:complete